MMSNDAPGGSLLMLIAEAEAADHKTGCWCSSCSYTQRAGAARERRRNAPPLQTRRPRQKRNPARQDRNVFAIGAAAAGDRILAVSGHRRFSRREPPAVKGAASGMAFERGPFNPEAARLRAGGGL